MSMPDVTYRESSAEFNGGAGLTIHYEWSESAFGPALALVADDGGQQRLCGFGFAAQATRESTFEDFKTRWPEARYCRAPDMPRSWAARVLRAEAVPLLLIGTPFQLCVWRALRDVGPGQLTTYSDIAHKIGAPKAVRAVGTAVGRNPISIAVPCHRVLRKDGHIGGYHWGPALKERLLEHEAAQHNNQPYHSAMKLKRTA